MYYTEDILLKKTSSKENYDLLQFMNPFDNQVWFATLATLVVISIAVFVINYYSPYGFKDEMAEEHQRSLVSSTVCGLLYLACYSKGPTTHPVVCQVRCSVVALKSQAHPVSLYDCTKGEL